MNLKSSRLKTEMNDTMTSMNAQKGEMASPRPNMIWRRAPILVILGCLLQFVPKAFSQEIPSFSTPAADSESVGNGPNLREANSRDSGTTQDNPQQRDANNDRYTLDSGSATVLTANQIITHLACENPTAMVDVKHVMAEYFLKQGIAVHERFHHR